MKRFFLTLAFLTALAFHPEKANADFYLVGADVYSCQADGSNGGTSGYGYSYRYTTNSNDPAANLAYSLNGGNSQLNGISFDLSTGLNSFTFTTASSGQFNPGLYGGLMLFFNTTGNSYNPTTPGAGIAGDLVVFAPTSGGSFLAPVAGTSVQDYSVDAGYASYSGATSYAVDGYTVNVSSFNINTTPTGSFTLNVVNSVPEPSSYTLMAVGVFCLAAGYGYRRRIVVTA